MPTDSSEPQRRCAVAGAATGTACAMLSALLGLESAIDLAAEACGVMNIVMTVWRGMRYANVGSSDDKGRTMTCAQHLCKAKTSGCDIW